MVSVECETRACLSCFHQCSKHNPTNGCPSSTSPCPSWAPWHYRVSTESQVDQDGKSSGGRFASGLGLRKLFSGLGKSRSHSVGQLEPTSGPDAQASTPEVRRTPSFQLLHLVSLKVGLVGAGTLPPPPHRVVKNAWGPSADRKLGPHFCAPLSLTPSSLHCFSLIPSHPPCSLPPLLP